MSLYYATFLLKSIILAKTLQFVVYACLDTYFTWNKDLDIRETRVYLCPYFKKKISAVYNQRFGFNNDPVRRKT